MRVWNSALIIFLASLVLGAYWYERDKISPDQPPPPGYNLPLTSSNGHGASLKKWQGRWIVLTYGFATCPDVCPTTLTYLSKELKSLEPEKRKLVQGVLVGIDPERDSPSSLEAFLARIDPTIVGVTGKKEDINQLARDYGAFVGDQAVNHTAGLFIIDPKGHLKTAMTMPLESGALVTKLQGYIKI